MHSSKQGCHDVSGLYRITPLEVLRRTPGVFFDMVPRDALERIDAIDRVIHEHGAISPGRVGEVDRPWYMHPAQEDNLLVLHGERYVELYTARHGRIERFTCTPHMISHDGEIACDGPAILSWPTGVFHRVRSDPELGSASLNLAVHTDGFDIRHNFSIYDVDTAAGTHRVIREGHLDQPG